MTKADELQKSKSTGRVLLYMRAGEDVSIIRKMLAGMAAEGVVCTDIKDLCRRMARDDVNAVFLTEQALSSGALPVLAEALRNQPHWSDLPVLFVASGGLESPLAVQAMQEFPNVLVLDRPVRMATLAGALQMALRMRTKQRQVRDLLDERRRAEEALENANYRLHAQAEELAAANEQLLTERDELQRQSLELAQLKDRTDRTARTMERLARSVEENPDPVLRVSIDGRIHYKNPASYALCRQWNPDDTSSVPPAVQEIMSTAYARAETIRREMAFGRRVYLITVAPASLPAKRVNIFVRDITERKRAEEALRESERRLHLALESARMGAWQWEVGTERVTWSPEVYALLGYEPGQVTPSHEAFRQRIHPEDLARWEQAMRESLELCEDYLCEFRVVWADGSVHWVEGRGQYAYPRDDSATQTVWMRGVLSDIELRKQAEEALRENEQRLRSHIESSPLGVVEWDKDFIVTRWAGAAEKILGWSAAETVGKPIDALNVVYPDDRPIVARTIQRLTDGVSRQVVSANRNVTKTGAVRYCVWYNSVLFDANGKMSSVLSLVQDVTEQKQAEEALRRSEEQYHRLFEDDLTGNFICTPEGKILLCNPAFAAIFGFSRPVEAVGTNMADLYIAPAERAALLERLRKEGKTERLEVWRQRRDGTPIHIIENLVGHFNEQGELYEIKGYVFEDTQRKRAEEALRELTATLESKVVQRTAELQQRTRQLQKLTLEMSEAEDRERERLAHILHDDLQQELAAAKFHLSVARGRARGDPAVQEITLKVDEMLKDAIGKSRSLSHELSPAVLHQGDFAEALHWLADDMQDKHGLVVHVHGRASAPSDAIRAFLYRAAQELLFNAVKHAQVNEARVRVRQYGGCICLSVSDRGRGFDPDELRETAGFGLLSIRERIELLGGRMKIRSAPGQGSTFFVVVPDGTTTEDRGRKTEGGVLREPPAEPPLRIVLADDHEVVRQGLAALLGEEGTIAVVGEAGNGQQVVELVERLHPDVVLMDVSMPVMSGAEATRRIKQDLPETRIVALSMREEPEVRQKMQEAGADSYILKTAPYKELLAAIRGKESDS